VRLVHDWYDAPLPDGVELGEGSWLYSSFAFLHHASTRRPSVRIGRHSGVYLGTFFDLGPDGEVEVGDYSALVAPLIATNARVSIGDHVLISHNVVLADRPAPRPAPTGPGRGDIVIGDAAWIGVGAAVLGGVTLGPESIVAANAVVDSDVPPGATVAGNPARVVGRG
jgi:acetyltransferase-like isoleucine patch superfamily enzyme